jgi:hypothetical protein
LFALGSFWKMAEIAHNFGLLFSKVQIMYYIFLAKMGWATFWAIFSQTVHVTLFITLAPSLTEPSSRTRASYRCRSTGSTSPICIRPLPVIVFGHFQSFVASQQLKWFLTFCAFLLRNKVGAKHWLLFACFTKISWKQSRNQCLHFQQVTVTSSVYQII